MYDSIDMRHLEWAHLQRRKGEWCLPGLRGGESGESFKGERVSVLQDGKSSVDGGGLHNNVNELNATELVPLKMIKMRTSGQDGSIGRRGLPPRTTTSKLQLKHKTTIVHNCQKSS